MSNDKYNCKVVSPKVTRFSPEGNTAPNETVPKLITKVGNEWGSKKIITILWLIIVNNWILL